MGALASDYINKATNNPSYVGTGAFTAPPAPTPTTGLGVANSNAWAGVGSVSSTVANSVGSFIGKRNPYLFGVKTAYDITTALNNEVNSGTSPNGNTENADAMALGADVDSSVSQYVELLKYNQEYTRKLEEELEALKNNVTTTSGDTLPSVLVGNTKALVTTLGAFTTVFNEKFDTLNGALTGMLVYFNDLMNLKNEEIPLNIASLKYQSTISSGMLSPRDAEFQKNLSVKDYNDFQNSPVSGDVLSATNLSGLSPREIQVSKHSYDIEAKEYAKAPQTVKDWDENILADISPREARLVKDATVAIKTTDENNLELDTDDIDIVMPFDISSINGFTGCDSVYQALLDKYSGGGAS